MRFIRVFTVILLLCLLMAPVFEANPGGNGDSTRDFACGGACHADPDLSAPSSAQIMLLQIVTKPLSEVHSRSRRPFLGWNSPIQGSLGSFSQ